MCIQVMDEPRRMGWIEPSRASRVRAMPQRSKPSPASRAPVQAVLFDAYGTLFDVYSVATLAEQFAPGRGDALAQLWRDKQIDYTRVASMGGRYRPFWDITRAGLRYACAKLALDLAPEREAQLLNQYLHLGAFPENLDVLRALKARGIPAGILSNGDARMLSVAVKSAGFEDLLHPLLSVDAVERFKPDPAVYALGPAALGLPARQILFVSSNGWDAIGATWFGYTTLWVNRARAPLEVLDTEPSAIGASLRDVLDFFPAT
jgi:2-haloacid dehalogenase